MESNEEALSQEFIEEFYPGYSSCPRVAFSNMIKRVLDQDYPEEENDSAYLYLLKEFNGEHYKNLSEIRFLYQSTLIEIQQKAMVSYMNKRHEQMIAKDMEGFIG